ncbi:unnamed protein product [Diabrotica balteata]|uniref:Uncharacterized protein n=1 Tax=Diabrotica balteata TaxID=107213 RepID=A0A9N9SWE0_DIABA|nr:unnamed protein product [Diabrotica balteata]
MNTKNEQDIHLQRMIDLTEVKQQRACQPDATLKKHSFKYHVPLAGRNVPVCREGFFRLYDVSHKRIRRIRKHLLGIWLEKRHKIYEEIYEETEVVIKYVKVQLPRAESLELTVSELWSSKSTSKHVPILPAGSSTIEGSLNATLMQGCSTTSADNGEESTKHCEEYNSSIEMRNILVSPAFGENVVDSGSDFSAGISDNYLLSDDECLLNVKSTDSDLYK